jgi:adenosylcobinamide kinase/adenosylcobinamide-phosphate guanylyltransferase
MGIVPSYKLGNIFRDIAGRINQYLAKESDEVYITISGIPLKLKG